MAISLRPGDNVIRLGKASILVKSQPKAQLFVKGELIGGCDIVMEMNSKGELGDILKQSGA